MRVDYLIVADAAQITSGKLYLLGGGWNQYRVRSFPSDVALGVAVGVRVDWNETNVRRKLELLIQDGDGSQLLKVEGQFETGRPAGIPQGASQVVQIAANGRIKVAAAGSYQLVCTVDGEELQRVPFYVSGPARSS